MTTIKITCGSRNDHHGKTTFYLDADGSAQIHNEHLGEQQKFASKVNAEVWAPLVERLSEYKNLNAVSMRKGTAHEALYEIQFSTNQDARPETFTIWHNDLKKYPAIKAVVDTAREIVKKHSDGKVLL